MTRKIENRIEVPGTPEEVWEAIATGHGIEAGSCRPRSSRASAAGSRSTWAPGWRTPGTVTACEPPHRFAYEEEWEPSRASRRAGSRPSSSSRRRPGGTCVVRLVSTLHADGGDWDEVLETMHAAGSATCSSCALHLTHFPGQRCATRSMAPRAGDAARRSLGRARPR